MLSVGKRVFAQVMELLPLHTFRRIVTCYRGARTVHSFSCLDQFLSMAFAQLTYRESLREIEACLRAHRSKLYPLGLRSAGARNTLAKAVRNWRLDADFAQPFGVDVQESVYALDTTTIDLCLSVFSWASFRSPKAAVNLHTRLDLRGNIPTFIPISDGTRATAAGARRVLPHGSGRPRLRTPLPPPRGRQLFHDPRQGESQSPTAGFASCRSRHRIDL